MSSLATRLRSTLDSRAERQILRSLDQVTNETLSPLTDFSSNDYLSFGRNGMLREKFLKAVKEELKSPYGPPSSRLLDGNSDLHLALEAQLCDFFRGDGALLYNSGFDANVGTWSCLPDGKDYIVFDELIHASTHDGMKASRVPGSCRHPFLHNDVEDMKRILKGLRKDPAVRNGTKSVWIAVEALYSMDGDLAPLKEMLTIADEILERGNAHFVVDEAHSTGLYGPQGRGVVCALGVANRVTVRIHTFGKSLACSGAVVIANPLIRSFLVNYSRPLIYSTAMPYINVLAAAKSFEMLEDGQADAAAAHVHTLSSTLLGMLSGILSNTSSPVALPEKLPTHPPLPPSGEATLLPMLTTTPIVPLLTRKPRSLSRYLISKGFLVRPICYPTVPRDKERVRICLHANNTEEQIRQVVAALREWIALEDEDSAAGSPLPKL